MIPGTTGIPTPQPLRIVHKAGVGIGIKKYWVMAELAPAWALAARARRSASGLRAWGCTSG